MMVPEVEITEEMLRAWTHQIVNGRPIDPQPVGREQLGVFASLAKDVAKIKAKGGVVDIPFELPAL